MRSLKIALLGVWIIMLASCASTPISIPTKAEEASFVFLGTVTNAVGGGTKNARAVRVDRIYFQRGTFDDQTGLEVIITGKEIPTKGQYVFHVEPAQFGARIQAELQFAESHRKYTEDEVKELRHMKRRLILLRRVKGAELIFVGSVASTRPWEGKEKTESEHDPQYTWATATVRENLRGRTDGTRQDFLFAASDDVHWYRSPKPRVGANVMFLLRKGSEHIDPAFSGTWTLLHEGDLLEGDDINIVREIISKGGAK